MRTIKKKYYRILQPELDGLVSDGKITEDQYNDIIGSYIVVNNVNFIRVLLTLGGLLLGLGVLTFIASNWQYLGQIVKLILIIGLVGGVNLSGYKLRENYPRVSNGLLYAGALIYGAGIFLIAQMFNFTLNMQSLFLLWSLGIMGTAIILNDSILLSIIQVLNMIYIFGALDDTIIGYPLIMILMQVGLVLLNDKKLNNSVLELFNIVHIFTAMILVSLKLEVQVLLIFIFILLLGFVFSKLKNNEELMGIRNVIGNLTLNITAFIMTFDFIWEWESYIINEEGRKTYSYIDLEILMWIFVVGFISYLIYKISKGSLGSITVLTAIILRYYIDISYDFMPKSLFFIIGGLLLMGFGIYFEKQRKRGRVRDEFREE